MRERWEGGWGKILGETAPNLDLVSRHQGEVGNEIIYMLNWMDWMGVAIRHNWMDKKVLFDTLSAPMKSILNIAAHQIQIDIDNPKKGRAWWGNVLYIADLLDVDISAAADRLRSKWIGQEHRWEFTSEFHNRLARNWPEPREQLHAGGWGATTAMANRLSIKSSMSVLDVCCGEGGSAIWLAKNYGANVVGVDIVPQAIAAAKTRAESEGVSDKCTFVCGNIFALPFKKETFDIIIGQDPDGFAHRDRLYAFNSAHRVLKKRGRIGIQHWIPGLAAPKDVLRIFDQINVDQGFQSHANVNAAAYVQSMETANFQNIQVEDCSEMYSLHHELIRRQSTANNESLDSWTAKWLDLAQRSPFGVRIFAEK